jgi:uncharacterized protein DUF6220
MRGRDLEVRTMAKRAYTIGVWLLLASIIVQFLLAGLGIFASSVFFYWHASVNAGVVGLLPLVLVAVGWLGRVPRHTLWLTAVITGLVGLQSLLLFPYHMGAEGWLRAVTYTLTHSMVETVDMLSSLDDRSGHPLGAPDVY